MFNYNSKSSGQLITRQKSGNRSKDFKQVIECSIVRMSSALHSTEPYLGPFALPVERPRLMRSPRLCKAQVTFQYRFAPVISPSRSFTFTGKWSYSGVGLFSFPRDLLKGQSCVQRGKAPSASVMVEVSIQIHRFHTINLSHKLVLRCFKARK
ncbi:hypothetical protein ATANTOWER_027645 [Ataeniobius toweri]|uniref:Uncharacterized protein n=1 Tax=Ataeniobius toweri TaxID=208326 RepID=A0ABU7BKZ3_9TELE|nr:hypothetical protein [Ataeniobius toweri]